MHFKQYKLQTTMRYFLFTLILISFRLNAQSKNDTHYYKLEIPKSFSVQLQSKYNPEGAKKDIENNSVKILFSGGFGGMPSFNNKKDISFQKKYSVQFYSQGCVRIGENENEEGYNLTIFNFLDKKFGTRWRKDIRTDAIGLKLFLKKM